MIWNKDYINVYLSAKRSLNYMNVEKLTIKQIEHIGKLYNSEYYDHYKKQVFFRWFSEYTENSPSFIRRTKKLLKKLNVTLTEKEKEKISNLEPREFTERRAMKTIEVPYKGLKDTNLLDEVAMFFYKDVRAYIFNIDLYRQFHRGEIYITKSEIVLFDRINNKINQVIKFEEITGVTLRSFAVQINLVEDKPVYLRYKDNELIYISLNRSIPIRKTIEFSDISREESDTAERTIESILNL